MATKRIKTSIDLETNGLSNMQQGSKNSKTLSPGLIIFLIVCLILLPVLLIAIGDDAKPSTEWLRKVKFTVEIGSKNSSSSSSSTDPPLRDKFLGGLLSPNFDESSCLSRYQSSHYHKPSPYLLSPYLIEKLRGYEALHRRCGPHTESYNKSLEQLRSSNHSNGPLDCNYVVWLPYNGFGNRVLTIVSAFLYALLNNKVLLLHVPEDFAGLLCEPFPETSWVLPSDFPIENLENFDSSTPQSYGNLIRNHVISNEMRLKNNVELPAYIYLHLEHDYESLDKLFFCEDAQELLQKLPWLLLKSDNYFVPALFLMQNYDEELNKLFPQREAVFHHLGRHLLHPTNQVWGYILRYFHAYLASADERLGLQIRIFEHAPTPFETMLGQIVNCSINENLLPAIDPGRMASPAITLPDSVKVKAVLVTTLYSSYFEKLKNMYYEHPTATGEVVGVYQPSHEEEQHTDRLNHNVKAWSEIYLLSFCDVLMTSAWSTFGYVAQGIGGLKPWILLKTTKEGDLPCRRAASIEPCFHSPPSYDCKAHKEVDKGAVARHVRHCEDLHDGLKLFD